MRFENKVAVVTGGAHGIGKCICELFEKEGAKVCVIDLNENLYFQGDLSKEEDIQYFAEKVLAEHGHIDLLINNAAPRMRGLTNGTAEDMDYALKVGVTAPFLLTKLFKDHFAPGAAIVNITSTRDSMSEPETETYAAAKGAISALTHAMAMTLAGIARVNAIAPGWIEVNGEEHSGPDADQHPVKRVGVPEDIAEMVLFLCSDQASFITGENIRIDGGMTRQMVYHGDSGWSYGE